MGEGYPNGNAGAPWQTLLAQEPQLAPPTLGTLQMPAPIKKPYIYTMEYYSAVKEKELLPSVTTWLGLEGMILREINLTEKD